MPSLPAPTVTLTPVKSMLGTSCAVVGAADAACYAAKELGKNRVHVSTIRLDPVKVAVPSALRAG